MYRFLGLSAIFLACLLFAFGCAIAGKLVAEQEWSENYALLEGTRATSPEMIDGNPRTLGEATFPEGETYGLSPTSEAIVTLPEKKVIRRVVVHSENLKEFDVFADKDGAWRPVKEVPSVKSNPIELLVNAPFPTDRIRIRVLGTTDDAELRRREESRGRGRSFGGSRRAAGKINEIELYGYISTEEVSEQKIEDQREKELDELLK